jgi:hypothetical protein
MMFLLLVMLVTWHFSGLDINDLPDAVSEGSTTRLFADDCALYRDIKTTEDARKLHRNNNGPRTLPWGTPEWTGAVVDFTPSTRTCCVQPSRKLAIHWLVLQEGSTM